MPEDSVAYHFGNARGFVSLTQSHEEPHRFTVLQRIDGQSTSWPDLTWTEAQRLYESCVAEMKRTEEGFRFRAVSYTSPRTGKEVVVPEDPVWNQKGRR